MFSSEYKCSYRKTPYRKHINPITTHQKSPIKEKHIWIKKKLHPQKILLSLLIYLRI